jgi:F-type H+-transporting ATPase subunit epsilon
MKVFKLQILTPNKKLFDGEVVSLIVPTKEGQLTILNNHTPIVSVLSIGEVILEINKEEKKNFFLQNGVLEVTQSGDVKILADREIEVKDFANAAKKEEVEMQKEIEDAKERAKKAMLDKDDVFAEIETDNLERVLFINKKKGRNV